MEADSPQHPRERNSLEKQNTLPLQNGDSSPSLKANHQRFVLADPVAFRYLEKDPKTKRLVYRERLHGYELYAVEQWGCSRKHPTFVIVTYTGQEQHSIVVYVLSVPTDENEWSPRLRVYINAIRRYHARAKETPLGKLMVTNLSSFPSALTVVLIPDGDLRSHREAFVLNEDLKRLGCTGRAGLNLAPPIGATQAKFRELYRTSDQIPIAASVVELVKLCQAALMIFGKLPAEYADGLLCDVTEEKISDWWADIGAEYFDIDPNDGILGPTTVAALLGLLMGARSRLHSSGAPVGKDAFDIISTKRAISYFQKSQKLERTRRLDRRTLDRLHKITAKAASSEGRAVPHVVKSVAAELSGKAKEMVDGREGASIAEIETAEMDDFIRLGYGERFKWLWHGKPRKHESDPLSALGDDMIFNGDEKGGGWTSKRRESVDDDYSIRQHLSDRLYMTSHGSQTSLSHLENQSLRKTAAKNMAGKHDSRSGLGKIRDAVSRRGHHQRMSRDVDMLDSQSSRDMTPRGSLEQAGQALDSSASGKQASRSDSQSRSGSHSQKSSKRSSRVIDDDQSKSFRKDPVYGNGSLGSYSQSSSSVDNPIINNDNEMSQSYVNLLSHANGITSRDKAHRPPMPNRDKTLTLNDMQAIDNMEQFEWAASKLPVLRSTRSMSTLFRKSPGKYWEYRFPRRMSFSIMSDILGNDSPQDTAGDDNNNPDTAVAHERLSMLKDQRMYDTLYTLKTHESSWVESKIAQLESFDQQCGKTQSKIDEIYQRKINENHDIHDAVEALVTEKKTSLTDSLRDIEVLEAKLEYELQALESKVEDAEDGVEEFGRQIDQLEARASELDDEPLERRTWLRTALGMGVF